jgi:dTDP-4-amino-4,6-dideoxygalactose transaminase
MRVPFNDLVRQYRAHAPALDAALLEVARSGWYALGPQHDAFEAEFAAYLGARYALGVANGTDALEIALRAFQVGPGDEVITAAYAGGYATTAIVQIGATPVYADIDPDTLTLGPGSVQTALSPHTKAVVITHLYGNMADVAGLRRVLAARSIPIIEDCAQAHGARADGRCAGTFGDAGAFSFYPTKNLGALGDGGMVVTNNPAIAERVRLLRQYGWTARYTSAIPGARNSRLDEIQAAVLRRKLPHLEQWNERRREIIARYGDALRGAPGMRLIHQPGPTYVGHLCVVMVSDRAEAQARLEQRGVQTAVHYPLLDYQQQALTSLTYRCVPAPHSEWAAEHVLSIPCFPELTGEEIEYVAESLRVVAESVESQ